MFVPIVFTAQSSEYGILSDFMAPVPFGRAIQEVI